MRKFALIVLFFFLSLLLSCERYDDDCPYIAPFFTIKKLNIYNLTYTDDRDRSWEIIPVTALIERKNFFMRVEFDKSYYSRNEANSGAKLFALSCNPSGYKGSQVGIDTLYLITQQDYNTTYLKNDTINDITLANYQTYSAQSFNSFFPLAQYIAKNDSIIRESYFELKLTEDPSIDNTEHQFILVFILDNGETFEVISEKVKLLQ